MSVVLRAYQAYQQQNFEQCLKLLQEVKQNDTRKLDLQAQVYFQMREYQKAYDIYQELLDKHRDEFSQERKENVQTLIVCAQLNQPGVLKTKPKDKLPGEAEIIEQVELINLKDESVCDLNAKTRKMKRSKKQKKRAPRLPKNYNPDVAPDPERWLARRDRSSYRQKKRRQRPNNKGGKSRAK